MSIKNSPDGTAAQFTVFFILSIFIHMGLALSLYTLAPAYKRAISNLFPEPEKPIIIDVVDLPPGPNNQTRPGAANVTRFANRSNSVEKETVPEGRKGVAGAPGPGLIRINPQATAGTNGAQSVRRASPEKPASISPPAGSGETPGADKQKIPAGALNGTPVEEKAALAGSGGTGARPAAGEAPASQGVHGGTGNGAAGTARPNLFLPAEKLSELEQRYERDAPQGEQGKTLQLNTSEFRYQKYLMNMKRRIELHWEYPELAVRSGWEGKLNINFTIKKDGTIGDIALTKSSGYPVLDDAAITALKLASPFPTFPENFGIEQINIKGQFEYNIVYIQPQR